ncbi:MAG: DUF2330 domain-containing protein [Myxococcales bacterium]|nr:DUF2330 domain-containing protein [Myxococcales bacterium]
MRYIAHLPLVAALVLPAPAGAFCGFFVSGADARLYNSASQVVLLRKGSRTVMTMSNNYKGPPEDFAMVVPVPVVLQKEQVKTLQPNVFRHIDQLSAPRLVEYWEQDPCQPFTLPMSMAPAGVGRGGARDRVLEGKLGVKIEAKFDVGEYQVVILSAQESSGLETWLRLHRYRIPPGASEALAPYIRDQMKFFVAKVDIRKVRRDAHGLVVLSPLRFSFDSAELRLPVRLGLLNAEGAQDLLIYILHPTHRFEVANYPNVLIPTNVEVTHEVRDQFGSFYVELFDATLKQAGGRAVVTEYAWDTSSCDPCPTPPLDASDLLTLGDDEVGGLGGASARQGGPRRPLLSAPPSYVLTRLHTRYDRNTLSEDLIFREAPPLVGGRANWDGTLGDPGGQVQPGGVNNFQGRYIIRHPWRGPVTCKEPRWGIWGGPPGGGSGPGGSEPVRPAQDLAHAPRGRVKLSQVVRSPVPSLGLRGQPERRR